MKRRTRVRANETYETNESASKRARARWKWKEVESLLPVHFCLCRPARWRSPPPSLPRDPFPPSRLYYRRAQPPSRRSATRSTLPPPPPCVYTCTLSRSHDSLSRSSPSLASSNPVPPRVPSWPRDTIDTAWSKRATQPYHHPATPRFRFDRPGEGAPLPHRKHVFSRLPLSIFPSFSLSYFVSWHGPSCRDTAAATADPTRHGSRRGPTLSTIHLALFHPTRLALMFPYRFVFLFHKYQLLSPYIMHLRKLVITFGFSCNWLA